jgi:hypothetical protein
VHRINPVTRINRKLFSAQGIMRRPGNTAHVGTIPNVPEAPRSPRRDIRAPLTPGRALPRHRTPVACTLRHALIAAPQIWCGKFVLRDHSRLVLTGFPGARCRRSQRTSVKLVALVVESAATNIEHIHHGMRCDPRKPVAIHL